MSFCFMFRNMKRGYPSRMDIVGIAIFLVLLAVAWRIWRG